MGFKPAPSPGSSGVSAWAASTAVTANQLLLHDGALYQVLVGHTTPSLFSRLNLRRLSPEVPIGQRPRHLTAMRDTRILNPSSSTLGTLFVQPEAVIRDISDGSYWCTCTFTGSVVTPGWLHCAAGLDPRDGANWVEAGAITGMPTGATPQSSDGPFPFYSGGSYYVLGGGKGTGQGIRLYKSNGAVNGTYSLIGGADLIPVGTTGAWDVARCSEPCYFRLKDGTHVIYYMGFDTGNTHEQIGYATCPAASSIELPGNWTKAAGNPVIPVGAAGSDDEQVVADPTVIEINGTYYMLYLGGAATAVANAVLQPQMLATSTDGFAWTKRGAWILQHALWPADDAPNTPNGKGRLGPNWRGHFYRLGPEYDNDVLWPYCCNYGSFGGNIRVTQGRLAVFPLNQFEVPQKNPWLRVQAEATDSRVSRTGTGWASNVQTFHNGGTAYFSAVAGDRYKFTFQGTGIRVGGQSRNNSGMFNVYLDGVQVATDVDAYQVGDTTNNPWAVLLVSKADLPVGPHTIEIEVSANKNAASTGNNIFVDYFEYLPALGA